VLVHNRKRVCVIAVAGCGCGALRMPMPKQQSERRAAKCAPPLSLLLSPPCTSRRPRHTHTHTSNTSAGDQAVTLYRASIQNRRRPDRGSTDSAAAAGERSPESPGITAAALVARARLHGSPAFVESVSMSGASCSVLPMQLS